MEYINLKVGDWVELLRCNHGGYVVGDKYQVQKIEDDGSGFSAFEKGTTELVGGFSAETQFHKKIEPPVIVKTVIKPSRFPYVISLQRPRILK